MYGCPVSLDQYGSSGAGDVAIIKWNLTAVNADNFKKVLTEKMSENRDKLF